MKIKYLFYFCQGIESVFDSQVLDLIKYLNKKNVFEKIYLFLGIRNEREKEEFKKRNIPPEIEIILYKAYPNYVFFNPFIRYEIKKVLDSYVIFFDQAVFHVREEILAWHLRKIIKNEHKYKILPDIRGACLEEILENNNINFLQKYFKTWNNKRALKDLNKFNKISAVSFSLKKYLINKFNIDSDIILITPDLAGKNFRFNPKKRTELRKALNIDSDEILILFSSGHTQEWQNWQNNDALKFIADKGIKILNLSKNIIEHKNVINKFIKYHDMPDYLNAADVAIIWSNKRVVTEVRSPVKFSEYICCGLPVIANDSVDMITDYIKKSSYGLLLDNLNELEEDKIKKLLLLNRTEISDKAMDWVGVENISQKYLTIYSTLL